MKTDVLIVGAGPIGSFLAKNLSKEGLKVVMIDKKSEIGKLACSGLISTKLKNFVQVKKEFLEHKIKGSVFHSPNYAFEIKRDKTQAYVVDRKKFDQFLLKQAENSGVNIFLNTTFSGFRMENSGITIKTKEQGIIRSKILVGADGAASSVRQVSGLKGNLAFVNGVIAYSNEKNSSDLVELFYGRNIAPNFFAWKIPRGETTEYGLAAGRNHFAYFRKFLKTQNATVKDFYSHPICFGEQETVSDRLILVGDAAAQVKPFSGGGIIYGLISAEIAKKAILNSFESGNFTNAFLKSSYENIWKKELWSRIELGLHIRKILDSLSDKELDTFFKTLNEHSGELKDFADMDFLS